MCADDSLYACGDGHCFNRRECRSGQPGSQGDSRRVLVECGVGIVAGDGDGIGLRVGSDRHQPCRCFCPGAGIDDGGAQPGRCDRRAQAAARAFQKRRGPDAGEGHRESHRRTESTADHHRRQGVPAGSGTRSGAGATRTKALIQGIVAARRKRARACAMTARQRPAQGGVKGTRTVASQTCGRGWDRQPGMIRDLRARSTSPPSQDARGSGRSTGRYPLPGTTHGCVAGQSFFQAARRLACPLPWTGGRP